MHMADGTPQAEIMQQAEGLSKADTALIEAQNITFSAIQNKASEMGRLQRSTEQGDKAKLQEMNLSEQQTTNLEWVNFLRDVPENQAYQEGTALTASASEHCTYIRVWTQNGSQICESGIYGATMPKNSRLVKITHLVGRQGGAYLCRAEGQDTLVAVPERVIQGSFILAHKESFLPLLGEAQRKTADSVVSYHQDPTKPPQIDSATLRESVRASGQISTESLSTGVSARMKRKELPAGPKDDAPPEEKAQYEKTKLEVDTYNAKIDNLISGLTDHAITTQEDLSLLMSLFGQEDLELGLAQQLSRIQNLTQRIHNAPDQATAERLRGQLAEAENEVKKIEDALAFVKEPENLKRFFALVNNGKLPTEVGNRVNSLLAKGDVAGAMKEIGVANFESLDEKKQEEIAKILGVSREKAKNALLVLGGGSLMIILLMIMRAVEQK